MYFSFPLNEGPLLREVYVVLLKGSKNILIDSGVSYNHADILQLVKEADLKISDIDIVLLTHCHGDHSGGLYRLKQENSEIKIWSHPLTKYVLEDIDAQFIRRPIPAYYEIIGGSVQVDHVLADGEIINIGYDIEIIYTPGHSDDSISFYIPTEKLLVSGDAIPYVHDIPIYEDLEKLKESLKNLKVLSPEYVVSSFCGLWDRKTHGDIFAITEKHLQNIQNAVDEFRNVQPNGSLEDMGCFVMHEIDVLGVPPIPIFLASIKDHIK